MGGPTPHPAARPHAPTHSHRPARIHTVKGQLPSPLEMARTQILLSLDDQLEQIASRIGATVWKSRPPH
jgi:hypothetical protein